MSFCGSSSSKFFLSRKGLVVSSGMQEDVVVFPMPKELVQQELEISAKKTKKRSLNISHLVAVTKFEHVHDLLDNTGVVAGDRNDNNCNNQSKRIVDERTIKNITSELEIIKADSISGTIKQSDCKALSDGNLICMIGKLQNEGTSKRGQLGGIYYFRKCKEPMRCRP